MRLYNVCCTISIVCLFLLASSQAEMSISITNLNDGDVVTPCVDFDVVFDVNTDGKEIKDLRLYANGSLKGRVRSEPWVYNWRNIVGGVYTIQAQLRAEDDTEVWSDPLIIRSGYVSRGEKVFNGNFDCGTLLAPWTMNVNAGSGAVATGEVVEDIYFDDVGYLFIEITNPGSEGWHVQLQQPIPVDSGHVYSITFLADADDQKNFTFTMQENQDPWAVQFTQEVNIDGADEYGPFEFVCQLTDPTNYIRFNLGGNTIPLYIDNIRIVDQSMSSIKSMQLDFSGIVNEYELYAAYPNPFNMNTTIPFRLSRAEHIDLAIYNIHGQRLKTLKRGELSAGTFSATWDGTDDNHSILPSGVYFYNMTVGRRDVTMTRKIIMVK